MKPLLIIKTGVTFPFIRELAEGDFEDWVIRGLGITAAEAVVVPVYAAEKLPDWHSVSGVVITGSHAMVTDREEWSEYTAAWLREIPESAVPVLGICYGHQLLAHAFGGTVAYHAQGAEMGTPDITLTTAGQKDALLGSLPPVFPGHAAHSQTVLELPPGAELLAQNPFEPHHAFVLQGNKWGVQFHPEFSAPVMNAYIDSQGTELAAAGRDVDALRRSVREHDAGQTLLRRFRALAQHA